MIRIPKSVVSFGALALAAGVLTLAVPRAAHAVAAALVQIGNPPASPANTEDTSLQAAQLVQLSCGAASGVVNSCILGESGPAYTVPGTQSLVITSVEFIPQFSSSAGNATVVDLIGSAEGAVYHQWLVGGPNTNSVEFQYPSGIVLPPGTAPGTYSFTLPFTIQMNGYLTAN